MATYYDDGTHTYEPGESNDRAVTAEPPPTEEIPPAAHSSRPPHPSAPGRPDRPSHPIAGGEPDRPSHPIAPTPEPKRR